MRFSNSALVLAALSVGEAMAGTLRHTHFHHQKREELAPHNERRSAYTLTTAVTSLITKIGISAIGTNAVGKADADSQSVGVWIGTEGPYTNEFQNNSTEPIVVVVWGPWASWVNVKVPLLTLSLEPNTTETISIASGQTGAWSAIYSDTNLNYGQVNNTWGEFTMGPYGVVNVSREPNMNGHNMTIVGPQCTTSMDTCVFVCSGTDVSCMYGYELKNCAAGSQPGAQYGLDNGAPSGGCGGMGDSAALVTTFH